VISLKGGKMIRLETIGGIACLIVTEIATEAVAENLHRALYWPVEADQKAIYAGIACVWIIVVVCGAMYGVKGLQTKKG